MVFKKLGKNFYNRPLLTVAKELLGKLLVIKKGGKILSGTIVEVEAYHGEIDEASHAFRGKTKRNEVMFWEGGHLYVYFTYGVHYCANVVVGKQGRGMAILLRAVEPISGISLMIKNRFGVKDKSILDLNKLTNGPGKLCKAFGIDRSFNGMSLMGDKIFIADQPKVSSKNIGVSKRIGITKSKELEWRFFIKNNPFISRK